MTNADLDKQALPSPTDQLAKVVPATSLPWRMVETLHGPGNAAYALHACNAYPKLVAALQQAVLQIDYMQSKFTRTGTGNAVIAESEHLLRSLGELK